MDSAPPGSTSQTGSGQTRPHLQGAPAHVAIIMDGNGRWAKARGLPRSLGHRAGVSALKRTVEAAPEFGVERLTVFGFSTENWRRPAGEVSELMRLMKSYVQNDLARLQRAGVRVRILGRREGLTSDVLSIIEHAEAATAANRRFVLQVAFNYGGRPDIVDAARRFAEQVKAGLADPADLNEERFESFLSTAGCPAPDLIVRTSGEQRLSNFLLWEAAYAEFVFQDVLWPDYGPELLKAAVDEFRTRERRYGGADVNDALAAG
ncbi:MAG TPA: polyprenyl diphosphate synthase [Caulobacteraceae bacterium]|nr:polyprenyl diphosphate synthase [Caulobacteraceae bacterium]